MVETPKYPFYTIYVFEKGITYDKPLDISVAKEQRRNNDVSSY